jgi:nucleotide-binding universal stress UspA family protein
MTPFRRILVPHDFSDHATAALRIALRLAPSGGRILVLHVVVPYTPIADIPPAGIASYVSPEVLVGGAREHLERTVAKTLGRRSTARVDMKVDLGDPHQRILDASRGMDLIVMSTAGRTGLSKLLIGSVTEKIVRHSRIPVLTLRPEPARKLAARRKRTRTRR